MPKSGCISSVIISDTVGIIIENKTNKKIVICFATSNFRLCTVILNNLKF